MSFVEVVAVGEIGRGGDEPDDFGEEVELALDFVEARLLRLEGKALGGAFGALGGVEEEGGLREFAVAKVLADDASVDAAFVVVVAMVGVGAGFAGHGC